MALFHSHPAGSQGKIQIIGDNMHIHTYIHKHTTNPKFKLEIGKASNSFLTGVNGMLSR